MWSRSFTTELPELKLQPTVAVFTENNVNRVGAYVKLEFHLSGLGAKEASDRAEVIQRLASNSLHRGATWGTVRRGWLELDQRTDNVVLRVAHRTDDVSAVPGFLPPPDGRVLVIPEV